MKINTKRIGKFLKSLTPIEFEYLNSSMGYVKIVRNLKRNFNITEEEICNRLEIPVEEREDFMKGNRNYYMSDFTALNALYATLEMETVGDRVPFQIVE